MTAQEDALARIADFLDRANVPYMVIGGIANLVWGEPRATLDIDVTVLVGRDDLEVFLARVRSEYDVLVGDAAAFVRETRVLPIADRRRRDWRRRTSSARRPPSRAPADSM